MMARMRALLPEGTDMSNMTFGFTGADGSRGHINPNGSMVMDGIGVNRLGEETSVADTLECECGADFGEYVRRTLSEPFPHSNRMPAGRDITSLWAGRRLRLKFRTEGEWRCGVVVSWYQGNTGPMSPSLHWGLTVRLDDLPEDTPLAPGDRATIQGFSEEPLRNYNGEMVEVKDALEDRGRYRVITAKGGSSHMNEQSLVGNLFGKPAFVLTLTHSYPLKKCFPTPSPSPHAPCGYFSLSPCLCVISPPSLPLDWWQ